MPTELSVLDMLIRSGLALLLGGLIGWDRERRAKAAGLRTMMLVSLGAAGFMMASLQIVQVVGGSDQSVRLDPLRVVDGIIGGIGFLGGGAIIQSRGHVQGMTTAASIWLAAGVGITCGLGLVTLAVVLTVSALVMLIGVTALKGVILPDKSEHSEDTAE